MKIVHHSLSTILELQKKYPLILCGGLCRHVRGKLPNCGSTISKRLKIGEPRDMMKIREMRIQTS